MEKTLEILEKEELYLNTFTNSDAFYLGQYIASKSILNNYPIEISIEKNKQEVFRYVNDGASANNHYWVEKKMNVVERFDKSSAFIALKLLKEKVAFKDKYGDDTKYAPAPGAVPIRVHGVGTVGVIAVSGLESWDDHQLIIDGLNYLNAKQKGE